MEGGEEDEAGSSHPSAQMTTISSHSFGCIAQPGDDAAAAAATDAFTIRIIENIQEDYGMFVWPCSIVLGEYVWQEKAWFRGKSVVELGAGTSLPGLVAAKVGADVILTDNANRLEVLENMRKTSELNNLNCKVLGLTWGEWDEPLFSLKPRIILGADVLYDAIEFDNLFATVTFLLHRSPGSVFITSYHNRSGHRFLEFLMVKWGLKCTKLVDAFSFMPSHKASAKCTNIQLVEIVLGNT